MESSIKNIEIVGIEAAVPCNEVDNALYISQIANRRIKKQIELTGVKKRRVTVGEQKASDLAAEARVGWRYGRRFDIRYAVS